MDKQRAKNRHFDQISIAMPGQQSDVAGKTHRPSDKDACVRRECVYTHKRVSACEGGDTGCERL